MMWRVELLNYLLSADCMFVLTVIYFRDEAIAKLNLNFGHAQHKLDRISLRVDTDVMPRHLRTRLTPVTFGDTPIETLNLGLTSSHQLFEMRGNLSPLGIGPAPVMVLPLDKQSDSAKLLAKKYNKRRAQTAYVDSRPSESALDVQSILANAEASIARYSAMETITCLLFY